MSASRKRVLWLLVGVWLGWTGATGFVSCSAGVPLAGGLLLAYAREAQLKVIWSSHTFGIDRYGWEVRLIASPSWKHSARFSNRLPVGWVLTIPWWVFGAVAGVVAGLLTRRRVVAIVGHCAACGYCLRGATSNRCPECGGQLDGSSP